MKIHEKQHRLAKEFYIGETSIAFTLCIKPQSQLFIEPEIANIFTDILREVVVKENCIVPVYCFMPDHQHLILTGRADDSDILKAITGYKQRTGFWFSRNRPAVRWQKDFYDHVIRTSESIAVQVRYILDNPVRKGLVSSWDEYVYKGAIGCNLADVLTGIVFR